MTAIPETVTIFDVLACLATPVAHLAIVLATCIDGLIADGDLGSTASLALKVGGLVHVMVDAVVDTSYSISGSEMVRTPVHGQAFVLEGLLQGPNTMGDLASFGVVSTEILDLALQHGVIFGSQSPID